jgi:hypothetical protein
MKKPLNQNPEPEKGVFHTAPDGRIVKAPRTQALKAGWHVTTAAELAAAEKAEAARRVAEVKKGG